jgi:hypothetical protein
MDGIFFRQDFEAQTVILNFDVSRHSI